MQHVMGTVFAVFAARYMVVKRFVCFTALDINLYSEYETSSEIWPNDLPCWPVLLGTDVYTHFVLSTAGYSRTARRLVVDIRGRQQQQLRGINSRLARRMRAWTYGHY